jgi:hypothetical protein
MSVSEETELEIVNEFLTIFQSIYGAEWPYKLTARLRPSPIRYLSQKYDVRISYVRKIRQQFCVLGHYILFRQLLLQPLPTQSWAHDQFQYSYS